MARYARKSTKSYKGRKPVRRARKVYKPRKLALRRNPFPTSTICTMKYCSTFQLEPAQLTTAYALFNANSIYDPDVSGLGHQPYGHDQYQALYNHYRVEKSRISITFISSVDSTLGACYVGIALKDDTTTETNIDTVREAKGSKGAVLTALSKKTITAGYNAKIQFPKIYQAITAQFGANPTEQAIYQIFAVPVNAADNPGTVSCVVTVHYTVLCWELKDLGQS